MEKFYRFSFISLHILMMVVFLHWFWVSFLNLNLLTSGGTIAFTGFVLISYLGRKWLQRFFEFLMRHKGLLLAGAVCFQLVILLTSELMIRRDAAVVFLGATKQLSEQSISNYITRNPNNLPLFLYERFFYHLFGRTSLWVLQALNLFYTNISALILYKGVKKHFGQKIGDVTFSFYLLLLAFSPYAIAMYTDMLTMPLICLQLVFALDVLKAGDKKIIRKQSILLGVVTAIGMAFRPTVLLLLIALYALIFFQKNRKKFLTILLFMGLSLGLVYGGIKSVEMQQKEVTILQGEGLAKGPLLFINLGLTDTGTNQADMKKGLLNYIEPEKRKDYNNGMFKTENVIKEIKRRLSEYTPASFWQHVKLKESRTVDDGTLGWLYYRDINKEKTPYVSPIYSYSQENELAEWLRQTVTYTDGQYYWLYALVKQFIWLLMAFGLVLASVFIKSASHQKQFLLLAIFGGLAFLMIFEGGKGRYLIQFLPQILLLASLGWQELVQWWKTKRRG